MFLKKKKKDKIKEKLFKSKKKKITSSIEKSFVMFSKKTIFLKKLLKKTLLLKALWVSDIHTLNVIQWHYLVSILSFIILSTSIIVKAAINAGFLIARSKYLTKNSEMN